MAEDQEQQAEAYPRQYVGRGAVVSTTTLAGDQVDLVADDHGYITPADANQAALLATFQEPEAAEPVVAISEPANAGPDKADSATTTGGTAKAGAKPETTDIKTATGKKED